MTERINIRNEVRSILEKLGVPYTGTVELTIAPHTATVVHLLQDENGCFYIDAKTKAAAQAKLVFKVWT